MIRHHDYELGVLWTGNTGRGTADYRGYGRDHTVVAADTSTILGSSDPAFRGDPSRWNPEQLFLASIANCHMLWYLHLAAQAGIVVVDYRDSPTATMRENIDGSGDFTAVTLRPHVTVSESSDPATAAALHDEVGKFCFIARSVTVPIDHAPVIDTAADHGRQGDRVRPLDGPDVSWRA